MIVKYGNSAVPFSVRLSTENDSAVSSLDFTQSNQIVNFSPVENMKSVRINLTNDDVLEGNEQFSATLRQLNSRALVLGALNSTTITINDDDSKQNIYDIDVCTSMINDFIEFLL